MVNEQKMNHSFPVGGGNALKCCLPITLKHLRRRRTRRHPRNTLFYDAIAARRTRICRRNEKSAVKGVSASPVTIQNLS